ncbi:MAG: lipid IV(A) 3-deoxy-D-manno-octulosonic acid transferase [Gammaproteobacteria bacterium]
MLLLRVLWRSRHDPRHRQRMGERLGLFGAPAPAPGAIWGHAVSVGESMAAVPLVSELRARFPQLPVVVTTTTLTGADMVARRLGSGVTHRYFPYDLPFIVRRFLDHVAPRMLIVLETELWPHVIEQSRRRGIPVALVNARLSQRSLDNYRRVRPLSAWLVGMLDCVVAQSGADAARFRQLGVSEDRTSVSGSLKFDIDLPPSLLEQGEALRRALGASRPVLMLGSTREGEEAILLPALRALRQRYADLLVVIAPRHPERFREVRELFRDAGFAVASHSAGETCGPDTTVYLLDTMGDMVRFYAAADIAFVGGSLLPYGGHNVLEPAALATPVLSGPHTFNFAEISELLEAAGALEIVDGADGLVRQASRWLDDSNERDRVGRLGQALVARHGGATARTLERIAPFLGPPG